MNEQYQSNGWSNIETAAVARDILQDKALHRAVLDRINSYVTADAVDEAAAEAGNEVATTWCGRSDEPPSTEGVDWQQLGEAFLFEVVSSG